VGFPERIERTVEVAQPPATVWAALTTAEGLSAWFVKDAAIDLRPGGFARVTGDNGKVYEMRVERVEEPAVFGFTWNIHGLPEGDPRRTYVEFTLEPAGAGTRLTVIESGFAQLPDDIRRMAYDGKAGGVGEQAGRFGRLPGCHLTSRRSPSRSSLLWQIRAGAPSWPRWPRSARPRTWPVEALQLKTCKGPTNGERGIRPAAAPRIATPGRVRSLTPPTM
jgi:uncharacterized protein YndB with AHSA1/START domain